MVCSRVPDGARAFVAYANRGRARSPDGATDLGPHAAARGAGLSRRSPDLRRQALRRRADQRGARGVRYRRGRGSHQPFGHRPERGRRGALRGRGVRLLPADQGRAAYLDGRPGRAHRAPHGSACLGRHDAGGREHPIRCDDPGACEARAPSRSARAAETKGRATACPQATTAHAAATA